MNHILEAVCRPIHLTWLSIVVFAWSGCDLTATGWISSTSEVSAHEGYEVNSQQDYQDGGWEPVDEVKKTDDVQFCQKTFQFDRDENYLEVPFVLETRKYYAVAPRISFACAIDSFLEALGSKAITIKVYDSDIKDLYPFVRTNDDTASCGDCRMTNTKEPYGLEANCKSLPDCQDPENSPMCKAGTTGTQLSTNDPSVNLLFSQLLSIEPNCIYNVHSDQFQLDLFQICASDVEVAFRIVFDQIKNTGKTSIRHIVIFAIDDTFTEPHMCDLQKERSKEAYINDLREVLGSDFNPPLNLATDYCNKRLGEFYVYFFNRYNIQIHIFAPVGVSGMNPTRKMVAEETGGFLFDLFGSVNYVDELWQIGQRIADDLGQVNNDQICLSDNVNTNRSIEVFYLSGSTREPVPRNKNNGWSLMTNKCLSFSGDWKSKNGRYEILAFTSDRCD